MSRGYGKKRKHKKRKGRRVGLVILGALLILVLVGVITVFSVLRFEKDEPIHYPETYTEVEANEQVSNAEGTLASTFDLLQEIRGNNDLSSILRDWATNNTDNSIMHSKDVTNILLIGIDRGLTNSDVIMLVSVLEKEHKIYLTSIMRDCFTFVQTPRTTYFGKINSAYGNGGADCLVQTVQNDFKIKVDYYVTVDFDSFKGIVDIMGGVEVPVMEYEMVAMGNLGTYGDSVRLNGEQALMYCRIRKCDADGDVSRTRRQRQFITSLINRTKDLGVGQLTEVVSTLLNYVKTDCPTTKILGYGTKALMNRWYTYDIIPLTVPMPDFRMDYLGYAWVWIVDYPPQAQYLQDTLYGSTNIKLNANRVSAIDVMRARDTGVANP